MSHCDPSHKAVPRLCGVPELPEVEALAQDLRGRLAGPPPDPGLRAALLGLRAELWTGTEEAARVVLRLRENRNATDLGTWLRALAAGVAAARRAGWTPTGYTVDGAE